MIITIERNEQTGRYHPFAWYESPLPSSDHSDTVQRFKSKCHHTAGFETEAEAIAEVPRMAKVLTAHFGPVTTRLSPVGLMSWDPAEVPAAVRFMEAECASETCSSLPMES